MTVYDRMLEQINNYVDKLLLNEWNKIDGMFWDLMEQKDEKTDKRICIEFFKAVDEEIRSTESHTATRLEPYYQILGLIAHLL